MLIEIKPLDTLFFRDGRPFSWGEETWAEGLFPPFPSTIRGALRSLWFSLHLADFRKASQEDDPTKGITVKATFLKKGKSFYFPIPLDVLAKKAERKGGLIKAKLVEVMDKKDFIFSGPSLSFPKSPFEKGENVEGFIELNELLGYLKGGAEVNVREEKFFVMPEAKIGIARDRFTRTSQEGKLYRLSMLRLEEDVSLIADVAMPERDLPQSGLIKLGGEGKVVQYQKINSEVINEILSIKDDLITRIEKNKKFKILFITPAIFKKGWLPNWVDQSSFHGKYRGIQLKLLAAMVGRPVFVGGFDMRENEPKEMYRGIPAGSVYYFEVEEADASKVIEVFHYENISDIRAEEGFGLSLVGEVNI